MGVLAPAPTKGKRPRTSFTNAQRLQICHYKAEHPNVTQGQLATWAQEALNLPRKPSQAMISKVLKRQSDLETMTSEMLTCKSRRTVRYPHLDTALARWVAYCEETGVPVTGDAIRAKAATFAHLLHIDAPLAYSNGWLYKFNERHGFGQVRTTRDGKGATAQAVTELQRRLRHYEPRNVFSMDETGLFFAMFPDRTSKRLTKRLTLALTCNADGSEKLPLLCIGKGEQPRGLTSTTAVDWNYVQSPTTFMTRAIFGHWLETVNQYFQKQARKCVVLIDNAPVHAGYTGVDLTHVEVVVFPPGTLAHLQPLGAGIVAAFKRRYRRRQLQQALDHLDADADMSTAAKFERVGVKQALTWCIEAWDATPSSLITSCWYETGLVFADNLSFVLDARTVEDQISEEVAVMLSWLHAVDPLTVDELLHLPEENVIMDEPTDVDFCAPFHPEKLGVPLGKVTGGDAETGLSVDELKERLKWIAKLLIYADEKGVTAESVSGMRILQRDFRDQLNKKVAGSS